MRGLLQLNRIIHNSHFKRWVSLEEQKAQKEYRFLRGRQTAYLIYEYFRVTGANDSVENNADLFTITLRNDDIQEFASKWDVEGLCKLRIREKLKTDLEIHQKKAGPDYHRLKTMVKKVLSKIYETGIFGARNGNYERNAVVKNHGTKQRGQRILGHRLQWETNGQCSKGDNCSFRHDINKRAKMTQPNPSPNSFMLQDEKKASKIRSPEEEVPAVERLDGLARITLKVLAITHFMKNGTLQNACSTRPRVVVGLGKSAHSHIVRLMNSRQKGLKRMMTKVQWFF